MNSANKVVATLAVSAVALPLAIVASHAKKQVQDVPELIVAHSFAVFDRDNRERCLIGTSLTGGNPAIMLFDKSGKETASVSSNDTGFATISVHSKKHFEASINIDRDGNPYLRLDGPKGVKTVEP